MSVPYLISKNGMWYAHNSTGYVARAEMAELYTEQDAKSHANQCDEVRAVPVTDILKSAEDLQEYIDRLEAAKQAIIDLKGVREMNLEDIVRDWCDKNGGWPEGANCAVQNQSCEIFFISDPDPYFDNEWWWDGKIVRGFVRDLTDDWQAAIVRREDIEGDNIVGVKRFVKRPVEIEAVRWDGKNYDEVVEFCPNLLLDPISQSLIIETLEGDIRASIGDWVIKGIQGEFYPCKPDIFNETYDQA